MNCTLMSLEDQDLRFIQGGFPSPLVLGIISVIQEELPDFISGWRDYQAGTFEPPSLSARPAARHRR